MKAHIFAAAILLIVISGCTSQDIQEGNPQDYELPGLDNTTIFYLNSSSVMVVDSLNNVTELRVDMGETGNLDIDNPVAVDHSGKNVSFNPKKVFGKSQMLFEFDAPFTGFMAYTQPGGQDFSRRLTKNASVMVVLPPNFTTGSRFLGIAWPKPDNITMDASGREILKWDDPYPDDKDLSVNYYNKNAPRVLGYFFTFLFITGLLLFGYYYRTIYKLKKKRNIMEKDIRKK